MAGADVKWITLPDLPPQSLAEADAEGVELRLPITQTDAED
jgi:hypothetical protein